MLFYSDAEPQSACLYLGPNHVLCLKVGLWNLLSSERDLTLKG